MPDDPTVEPLVPTGIVRSNTVSTAPCINCTQKVSTLLAEGTRDGHVTVRREDLDIMSSTVPTEAPRIQPTVKPETRRRKLLCKADMTELSPKRGRTNTHNSDNPFEMRDKNGRQIAKKVTKALIN